MADNTVKVIVTGASAGGVKAFQETALSAEENSDKVQSAWGKVGNVIKTAGNHVVSAFSPASNLLQNLPMFQGPIGQMFSEMQENAQGLRDKFDELGDDSKTAFQKIGAGMASAGLGVAGLGAGLDELSSPLESSQKQLEQAITNTGGSFDDYSAKIASAAAQMQNYGFRNQDTNAALTTLTTSLGSPAKALSVLGTAANLAATKHISLEAAATAVAKLAAGNGSKALSSLGISIASVTDAATKSTKAHIDFGAAIDAIDQKTQGQASAAVDSFGGHLDVLKDKVLDGAAQLGQKYGPALMGIGAGMTVVGGIMDGTRAILGMFSTGAEVAATATEGMAAADDTLAASETAADAAGAPILLTIGLIVAAVAVLGAAIYELVDHWSTVWGAIKDAASDAWNFIDDNLFKPIEDAAEDVINFIKEHWVLIVGILTGPIGLVVTQIAAHWNTIRSDASKLIGDITGFFTSLPDKVAAGLGDFASKVWGLIVIGGDWLTQHVWTPIANFFAGLPDKITSAAKGLWNGIADAFVDAINHIIGIWNNFHIPAIKVLGVQVSPEINFPNLPTVPHLAAGGIVSATPGGILALLGEGGNDEIVQPLPRGGASAAMGGSTVHNWNVTVVANDPQTLVNQLKQYIRSHGSLASAGIA